MHSNVNFDLEYEKFRQFGIWDTYGESKISNLSHHKFLVKSYHPKSRFWPFRKLHSVIMVRFIEDEAFTLTLMVRHEVSGHLGVG